jgi:hypothetical protein
VDLKFIVLIVVLLIIVGLFAALKGKSTRRMLFARSDFMTKSELEFWRLLVPAAAPLHVGPQVAMGALLKVVGGLGKSESTVARNRFDRKRVDFVLFDDAGGVQLIVELDDSTHRAAKDGPRDEMTESAGYKTLRLRKSDARIREELSGLISAKLAPKPVAAT